MYSRIHPKVCVAGAFVILSLSFSFAAGAETHHLQSRDTQEWGSDVVRIRAAQPGTLAVGPGGAGVEVAQDTETEEAKYVPGMHPVAGKDEELSAVDYCFELAPTLTMDGPYRIKFHFLGGTFPSPAKARPAAHPHHPSGGPHPLLQADTTASLTFDIQTLVATNASSGGDASLSGAVYDDEDSLVASDGEERLSTSLAAGDYTLVIEGGDQLTGTYQVTADQGTCE